MSKFEARTACRPLELLVSIFMRNCPGISWGYESHVNLLKTSEGYLALYYDDPESTPDIIRVFKPKNHVEFNKMMKDMTNYNYNTCALCPLVKMEIDWTC